MSLFKNPNDNHFIHHVRTGLIIVLLLMILVGFFLPLSPIVIDFFVAGNLAILIILLMLQEPGKLQVKKPMMWWITTAIFVGLGLIPGFPQLPFFVFALIVALIGGTLWWRSRK